MKKVTTSDFHNYLISLGLFRLTIKEDESGFTAVVNSEPILTYFTQVIKKDNFWTVRLSKKDLYNSLITKGFFIK